VVSGLEPHFRIA